MSIQKWIYVLLLWFYAAGIVYSKFILSCSMWGLGVVAFLDYSSRSGWPRGWRRDFLIQTKEMVRNPAYSLYALLFILILISWPYSDDLQDWGVRLRVKIPFLVLPLIFFMLPRLGRKVFEVMLAGTVLIGLISAVIISIKYFPQLTEWSDAISRGQHIPTPVHPIRYSLFLSLCIAFCLELWLHYRSRLLSFVFPGVAVFLLFFLHILAVRSGLFVCYALLLYYSVSLARQMKKWWIPVLSILLLSAVVFLAIKTIPSLESKVGYMRWQIQQFTSGNVEDYSDSERLLSYQAAWKLIQENPILGTGLGDLRNEMEVVYREEYGIESRKRPHNEFLTYWAGGGIIGLILFLVGMYGSLFFRQKIGRLDLVLYILATLSFLVENTIDGAVGTALVLGYTLLFLREQDDKNSPAPDHPTQ